MDYSGTGVAAVERVEGLGGGEELPDGGTPPRGRELRDLVRQQQQREKITIIPGDWAAENCIGGGAAPSGVPWRGPRGERRPPPDSAPLRELVLRSPAAVAVAAARARGEGEHARDPSEVLRLQEEASVPSGTKVEPEARFWCARGTQEVLEGLAGVVVDIVLAKQHSHMRVGREVGEV